MTKISRAEELRSTKGEALRESQQELKSRKVGGLTVYIAMFEPSTRTADKHFLAARWLDIFPLVKDLSNSSLKKGESKRDMVMNIAAQEFDALVIRDSEIDTPKMAADLDVVSVINAGNDYDDHPTQAEADLYTAYREVGAYTGLTVVISGDNFNGRVNRADIRMFSKCGNRLILASPPGLEIRDEIKEQLEQQGTEYHQVETLLEAVEFNPDFGVLTRFQEERYFTIDPVTGKRYIKENPRTGEPWEIDKITAHHHQLLALKPQVLDSSPKTIWSHPLPRGPELPDDENSNVVVWRNVKNGTWMSVADYEYLFGVGPFENDQTA
jgi:aspartate carbamoyltransferase catalytic subunit